MFEEEFLYEELEPEPDIYVQDAKDEIRNFFDKEDPPVFFLRQIQIFLTVTGVKVLFVIKKSFRYYKKVIKRMMDVINTYSDPDFTEACGSYAELLFKIALMKEGFKLEGEEAKEYSGKEWTKTGHDLDFIISKDGIAWGCEVKNTLAYIDLDVLKTKVEMCSFLGVKPMFIVRYAPKTYINYVYEAGGYTRLFVAKIFPKGHENIARRVREELKLNVVCPKAIPEGIIQKINEYHVKIKENSQ